MICDCGKVRYGTKTAAKLAIRRMEHRVGKLNAYRCPVQPGAFHIGHLPDGIRQGVYTRDDLARRTA